jgi:hypothetical protein
MIHFGTDQRRGVPSTRTFDGTLGIFDDASRSWPITTNGNGSFKVLESCMRSSGFPSVKTGDHIFFEVHEDDIEVSRVIKMTAKHH